LLDKDPNVKSRMVTIDPQDLIEGTFLKNSEEEGQRFHARVVRAIVDDENNLRKGSEYMKFICEVPNSTDYEILTYNEILDYIEKEKNDMDDDPEQLWKFRHIAEHQGPLCSINKDWKGSTYNIMIVGDWGVNL
jgi:hypothetical protein